MVVALAAAHGRAQPGDGHGPHAVAGVLGQVLAGLCTSLARHHVQAVEAGRHELLGGRVGQQVAGELLDGELVERLVAVERVDHVIAVREDALALVAVVADRVGEPGQVQPGNGHPLAVMGRLEQPIDQALVGARIGVVARRRGPPRASGAGRSGRARAGGSGSAGRPRAMGRSPWIRACSRMNASIGLRTQAAFLTVGIG